MWENHIQTPTTTRVNNCMNLKELGISVTKQVVSPISPGSRGLQNNKKNPARRWFDTVNKSVVQKDSVQNKKQ